MEPTITLEQANQKVEEYSKKAREALPAETRLTAPRRIGWLDRDEGGTP
ncbi:hypothetical protein [Amycolatopsis sp. GA6-003]